MSRLLAIDLASMLVFGGFIPADAIDDPEGYDNWRTLEKVGYLTDLINARVGEPVTHTNPPEVNTSGPTCIGREQP